MGFLDWFKQVYRPEGPDKKEPAGVHSTTPYFHLPEDRPKDQERHNLQQDLIDAIRKAGADEDPQMISALIDYIAKRSGIKTYASVEDPFLQKVFEKRKYDIRNMIEGFFYEHPEYLPEMSFKESAFGELPPETQSFVDTVLQNVEVSWMEKEFKETETETAIGPDGKERVFEKGFVPEGFKVVNKEPTKLPDEAFTEEEVEPPQTPVVPDVPQPPAVPDIPKPPATPVAQPAPVVQPTQPVEVPLQELQPKVPNITETAPRVEPRLKIRRKKAPIYY